MELSGIAQVGSLRETEKAAYGRLVVMGGEYQCSVAPELVGEFKRLHGQAVQAVCRPRWWEGKANWELVSLKAASKL